MAEPTSEPAVVYDANVLYGFQARNLLVQFAQDRVVPARWTDAITEEWVHSLSTARGVSCADLEAVAALMNRAVPGARLTGYEHLIPTLHLPDPDDRHVLAAAITAGASVILTENLTDFPPAALRAHGVKALRPDDHLAGLATKGEADLRAALRDSARRAHANLTRTRPSWPDYLEGLARRANLPRFVVWLKMGLE